jgi:Protein of unknown function (DUF1488)
MPIASEGWFMDGGPPSWDPKAKAFSFFLGKPGCERVLCIVALDVLESAVQSNDLSEQTLGRIFDAHRQMIELRASQRLNMGLLDASGSVRLHADDI